MTEPFTYKSFMELTFRNKRFYGILMLLVLLACLKLMLASHYELDSEEAQYWGWSKQLQLSYYSKPPLIAYVNRLSASIFGNTVFAIRINAALTGMFISLVSYWLSYELFKDLKTAFLAALLVNIFPFLLHSSLFFTPDSLLLFFWLLALLSYWKAVETGRISWWVLLGLSIGMGALSKYSIFLIYIPLLIFSRKYHREIFKSPGFYLSILVALLLFAPVILWNIRNHGLGFLHLIHLAGFYDHPSSSGEAITNLMAFSAGQVGLVLPFYQYRQVFWKYREATLTKGEELLILPAISIFIFFLVISMIRKSGVYINWTMFAYTGLPLLFAHYAQRENQLKINRRIFMLVALAFVLFFYLISPANHHLPLGGKNPLNKRIGWVQLANHVDSIRASMPGEDFYVFSTNYHITSELAFYLKGQPRTYCLNLHARMTQFDLWQGTEQFINSSKTGILVDGSRMSPELKSGFQTVLKEDSCHIYSQRRCIRTYYIYLVRGMKGFQQQPSSY